MMGAIEANIVATRGSFRLETALRVPDGITIVFGPSGSGKTTLLHAILGAHRPDRGRIVLNGRPLFDAAAGIDLPVRRRRIGIVFQDALLFPHMTAEENVAFAAVRAPEGRSRPPARWLERVGGAHLARRRPAEMSGGERQRVALARTLAAGPDAVLLDEPFSALDLPSREALGGLLTELQSCSAIPFVHVTHDAGEALRLGERLVLLSAGRVVQEGLPNEVLAHPSSPAAKRLVGTENLFAAIVVGESERDGFSEVDLGGTRVETSLLRRPAGSRVILGLRSEEVVVATTAIAGTSARNVVAGTIAALTLEDDAVELQVTTPVPIRVRVTPAAVREMGLSPGQTVYLLIKASAFHRVDG